jgi:hypothetical protein
MRYTFLLYSNPADFKDMTPADMEKEKEVFGAYIGALQAAGVFVDTDWLQPVHTATTVSFADGKRRIQDGPFATTHETLGGYFVIEAANLDVAITWAEKCPSAKYGKVEIRPSAMGS